MADAGGKQARLRLFRTTGFKLSVIYLAVFTIFAAFLIGYIARNTAQILTFQMREAVDAELQGLAEQYRIGGIRRLTRVIRRRSRQPGASLYLVVDPAGNAIVGNVASVPRGVLAAPDPRLRPVPYTRLEYEDDDHDDDDDHTALARVFSLPGGYRVLVGRDISERDRFAAIIRRSLVLTVGLTIVLGLVSWIFVSRRVLKRIESVAGTSQQIIDGDLSGRLEVTGTGDEFDRLAESLNAMLDRIERLMTGLKEVSDNIAHDLKTPLTRMRNRVETALAQPHSADEYRASLQATIDDADQLIRTFNALLAIARAESGSTGIDYTEIDAAALAGDIAELYEPLAEEAGVGLVLQAPTSVAVRGNRELLGQALANLVDNAIKHSRATAGDAIVMTVEQSPTGVQFGVADRGPGIPEADRERVRERFVRLEKSRTMPGAGLGLSLVAAVAKLHGGQLILSDNRPGLRAVLAIPLVGPHAG